MRSNAFVFLLLSCVCFLLTGCKPKRPSGVLSEHKMENVMVDYHLAQGMADASDGDREALRYKYIQAVFKKHHITEATFDSSLVYYFEHSEKFYDIYKKVSVRVQAQAEKFGVDARATYNQYSHLTSQGDTANVWTDHSNTCVIPNKLQNIYQFVLTADSTYQIGDSFIWHFHTFYISQGPDREAYAILTLQYENDSVVSVTQNVRGNNNYELKYAPQAPLDTIALRKINGFLYMPIMQKIENTLSVMLVQDLSMIRMHPEKKDSLELVDSLLTDTLDNDTLLPAIPQRRLSPQELRDKQPHDRKINVTKEKPQDNRRNNNNKNNNTRLRRRYQL